MSELFYLGLSGLVGSDGCILIPLAGLVGSLEVGMDVSTAYLSSLLI